MQDALTTAAAVTAIATLLLLLDGRRPLPFGARLGAFVPGVLALAFGAPIAVVGTIVAIAVLGLLLPRHWYAIGTWLFAALSVAFLLYTVYLARSVVLLGSDPSSVLLGLILLTLEIGAMVLLLTSTF